MKRILIVLLMLVPSLAAAQRKIVIDPGHGGSDPGGVGNGLQEKNIVLDVSQRFKSLLDVDNGRWTALLTRNSDVFVSLASRAAFSNNQGASRFMSIHSNAFSSAAANGTETFAFAEGGTGAALRNLVQAEMIAAWGLTNRGNKTANFFVLRETAAPAVLHELAFITNAGDAAKLGSATERQKAAVAHRRALRRHFGFAALQGTGEASDDVAEPDVVEPETVDDPEASADAAVGGCNAGTGAPGALVLLGLAGFLRRRRRR